jgi:hypothetical protein
MPNPLGLFAPVCDLDRQHRAEPVYHHRGADERKQGLGRRTRRHQPPAADAHQQQASGAGQHRPANSCRALRREIEAGADAEESEGGTGESEIGVGRRGRPNSPRPKPPPTAIWTIAVAISVADGSRISPVPRSTEASVFTSQIEIAPENSTCEYCMDCSSTLPRPPSVK